MCIRGGAKELSAVYVWTYGCELSVCAAFKEEKSAANPMMIIMILLVLAGLGGAAYLFS